MKRAWDDVGLSPLVRAGARWLSFARGLSRGARRRTAAADTLAFIESLYGKRYTAVESSAYSFDKVYRTAGGGLFVSETRLNLSVHPRFDLSLLNVVRGSAGSQTFRETTTPLPRAGAGGREHPSRHTGETVFGTSLTVQTWNVSPAFGYVNVRGQRASQSKGFEPSRPGARGNVTTSPSTQLWSPAVAPAPASLQLTSLDLLLSVIHSPRQEFVSTLLNTYFHGVASRVPSVISKRDLSRATGEGATAQGETSLRFAPAPGTPGQRAATWTYAEPAPRREPGGAVEIRREFRSIETVKEQAPAHDPQAPLLQVLTPTSILSSLPETSETLLAGVTGRTTDKSDGPTPALSFQLVRTHTARPGAREDSAPVRAPRLLAQTTLPRPTVARAMLSSLNTFAGYVHSTINGHTHTGRTNVFTRPGFETLLHRGFERILVRQRGTSSDAAPGHATSSGLFNRAGESVRLTSTTEFTRDARAHDTSRQTLPDGAPAYISTEGVPGSGTFLFATELLRRTTRAAGALSPTAATALRLTAVAETERASRETRAARPEGMALELVRQRREEVLQLPQPGYVYTQPARAQLEERQVINRASREEIVEVVRKEVRSLTSNAPAPAVPARADLAGIADEVYSTLVRRLLVEKERLGRF